ncbi:MAG TPA: hypothetical protein V6C65_29610, partial [Allocoleopsis sp.]
MKKPANYDYFLKEYYYMFDRLISQMPAHIVDTFTDDQLAALRFSSRQIKGKRHAMNKRLSISLFGKNYYLVVMAGQEQSLSRRALQKKRQGWSRTVATLFIAAALLISLATLGLATFLNPM